MAIAAALFSSEFDSWCTPAPVLECVRRIDAIGLDPFSNAQSIVGARVDFRLSRGENALRLDWRGHGLVYINPPFGDDLPACIDRVVHFAQLGVEIVLLVPHRTDTVWYRRAVRPARAKCEWYGRMKFLRGVADKAQVGLFGDAVPPAPVDGDTVAPFPSVLLYYGRRRARFARAFNGAGEIWLR